METKLLKSVCIWERKDAADEKKAVSNRFSTLVSPEAE
jgi:hypothetical protein